MLRLLSACLFAVFASSAAAVDEPHKPLVAPEHGPIPVAFVLTEGAVMIDFAGPWEVFQDVMVPSRGPKMEDQHVFRAYVVSDTKKPLQVSGGMTVTPDYTFDDAPKPTIVVVPAQRGSSPKMLAWLRKAAGQSDVVMSVCTGAFKLAQAGLLDGKRAATHHGSWVQFAHDYPKVDLQRDRRFVRSDDVVFTAGGLSSGIDLALHIVDAYFGRDIASATARELEYEGAGWQGNGESAVKYSQPRVAHTPADSYHDGALGSWRADYVTPHGTLRIALHLWPDAHGKLLGTLDSLDDDMLGMPIVNASIDGDHVTFQMGGEQGRFDGKLDAQRQSIDGTWTEPDAKRPVRFARAVAGGN